MARRRSPKNSGLGGVVVIVICGIAVAFRKVADFVSENVRIIIMALLLIGAGVILFFVIKRIIKRQREELLSDILDSLDLRNIGKLLKSFDDQVIVKSRQSLDNYDDIKYLRENGNFEGVVKTTRMKASIRKDITSFLRFDLSRIDSAVNGRKSFFMVLWQKKSHTFYSCKKV